MLVHVKVKRVYGDGSIERSGKRMKSGREKMRAASALLKEAHDIIYAVARKPAAVLEIGTRSEQQLLTFQPASLARKAQVHSSA